MGRIARTVITSRAIRTVIRRRQILLWTAATALAGMLLMSATWDLGDTRGLLGAVILLTGAAISASACQAIERAALLAHDDCIELLLKALRATRPTDPAASQKHRRAA